MPLYRKLPHRGFNQAAFRTEIAVVNVGALAGLSESVSEVNAKVLADHGLIRAGESSVKVLGDGELKRALRVSAAKFSASAKAKIEAAGGQAIVA
jgi:large subunit ribosomal protein L15